MWEDPYANDPVAQMRSRRTPVEKATVTLQKGLVLEHTLTEFCGAVVAANHAFVQLEDFAGSVRKFALTDSFLIDGQPVLLALPTRPKQRARTASGGFAATSPQRARVAQTSRIFVEGRHDAELVETVWGDDLREAGIVVELLEGADNLAIVLQEFQPASGRRAGVLLDHLVSGTKETKLAAAAVPPQFKPHVLITGHPYIDVWQAVKPARLGFEKWPIIPRGQDWKTGILAHLGWPHYEQSDIADGWQRILSRVRDYRDLEPLLVGPVEQLIDFVTAA